MSTSVNDCTFVGHLGKDPELKQGASGKSFAVFSIALSRGKGEEQTTLWLDVMVFDKNADYAMKYLNKGSLVYVRGELIMNTYTDKEGNQRSSPRVNANRLQGLSRGNGTSTSSGTTTASSAPQLTDEDIPF